MKLPDEFLSRMREQLGDAYDSFISSRSMPPVKGVRANTLKLSKEEFLSVAPFDALPVPWCEDGFYITEEKPGKFIEHASGLYYVQEPSAMCAVPLLGDISGQTVLDMCSAPGGKGTQLAQAMHGEGILFLNEINFPRAKILSQNVERMGVKNAVVTSASSELLAECFASCFDAILADAPCSGEGMFRKDEAAVSEWSPAVSTMCAERQDNILSCADRLLKSGGKLVYSTCTFSREEDEARIENFLKKHKNYTLIDMFKLWPHEIEGEGHFAALLQKNDGDKSTFKEIKLSRPDARERLYREFEKENLKIRFENLYAAGDTLYSLPCGMPGIKMQILRAGIRLGRFSGSRFEPAHSLAMCLKEDEARFISLDEKSAKMYLSGLTLPLCGEARGWTVVSYKGYPLGWCKAAGDVLKNHYPKGLRAEY